MLYEKITSEAVDWAVGIVEEKKRQAAPSWRENLGVGYLGTVEQGISLTVVAQCIKGDAKVYSISTASIIAKVTRDRMMQEYDEIS